MFLLSPPSVTVAGNAYQNGDAVECTEGLQCLLDTRMKRPTLKTSAEIMENEGYLFDESVIDKAMAEKNGKKFKKLYQDDITRYSLQSEANQALSSILAFYGNGNYEQIDKLFRQSSLMRYKWDGCRSGGTHGGNTI